MTTVFADSYGFNTSDATRALQAAINDPNADKIIVRNMNSPWFVSETIFLQSNKEIIFEAGVVVQAKPGTFLDNTRPMFRALSLDNIQLIGLGSGENMATIKMNKEEYKASEFGHILGFNGVKDFVVKGLKLTGAGGDGIHISGAAYETAKPGLRSYSENGLIENIISDNNRRQGISIDSAKNLTVRNSKFINTKGTPPSAGIDLEPTWSFESLQNIKIQNVEVRDNDGTGIQLALGNLNNQSEPVSIDIDGAIIDNSNLSGITIGASSTSGNTNNNLSNAPINGTVNIRNTQISRTLGNSTVFNEPSAGIYIQALSGDQSDPNNLKINFVDVTISDTANGKISKNPIFIQGFGGENSAQQVGNLSFTNVIVKDNFNRDIIRAELGRSDGFLNNISGTITAFNPNGVTGDFDTETTPKNFSLAVNNGNSGQKIVLAAPLEISLTNPSFNKGFQGWSVWDSSVSLTNRSADNQWVKINSVGGGLGQDITKDMIAGQNYVVGGTAKLSNMGDKGYLGVLFKDSAGTIQDFQAITVSEIMEKPVQLGFTAPSNFAVAQIFAWKENGSADFYVDDFSLVKQPTIR
jgi:Right handed beta helix region